MTATASSKKTQKRRAKPVRSSKESIRQEASRIERVSHLHRIIEIMPGSWAVLNRHRQIVFANKAFDALFDMKNDVLLAGQRIGELLGREVVKACQGGCDDTSNCVSCAITSVIDSALEGDEARARCELSIANDGQNRQLSYQFSTRPMDIRIGRYVLFSILESSMTP